MPFLAPFVPSLIAGGIGAATGALSGRGNQGRQTVNQTQNQTGQQTSTGQTRGSSTQRGQQRIDQTTQAFETPEMAAFRLQQQRRFQDQFSRAGQPIYGEAQKAGFLSNLNDLAASAGENLKQNLASSGGLDSGRAATGFQNIEMGRSGQAGQFFGNLPFLEQQAQGQRFNDLSGLANNFLATGPRGQRTTGITDFDQTGENVQDTTGQVNSTGQTTGNTTQTNQGPSFASGLLSGLGGAFGGIASRLLPGGNIRGQGNISGIDTTPPIIDPRNPYGYPFIPGSIGFGMPPLSTSTSLRRR